MKNWKFASAVVICLIFLGLSANAQDKADRPSPPKTATATVNGGEVVIDYSSPAVKGRKIWGDLVPYDKVWRTGANEATTIMFEKDAKIEGKDVKAGKYGLFTIPGKDEWTIILNSTWDQWGSYNYDASKDVVRFTVKPQESTEMHEKMDFQIADDGMVTMMWENTAVPFKIE